MVEAAVLAPVYRDVAGRLHLVLIVRGPRGVHGSQIALPGGRREPEDADLRATALREAEEEIGLAAADVEILADLPVVSTVTTGFHIVPFLGRVRRLPAVWRPQESEVADVLDVALDDLTRPDAHAEELWEFPSWPAPRLLPFYRLSTPGGEHKLWGATYRIVHPLIPRLVAGEWPV